MVDWGPCLPSARPGSAPGVPAGALGVVCRSERARGDCGGDVLSTHCDEVGDVIRRRVDWPSARLRAKGDAACVSASHGTFLPHKYWAHCARQVPDLTDDAFFVDCEWDSGPIFTNHLPLGRWGRHCVWVRFLATVGRSETLIIKTLSSPPIVP